MTETSYTPDFVSEATVAPPFRLCTMAAGAVLLDKQTGGKKKSSAVEMATLAGTGIYPVGGTTLGQVQKAFNAKGENLYIKNGSSWSDILKWGQSGLGMVVQGNYGAVPEKYRIQKDYTEGHAVYVDRIVGDKAFIMDPLGTGSYKGAWWPVSVLQAFAMSMDKTYVAVQAKKGSSSLTPDKSNSAVTKIDAEKTFAEILGVDPDTKLKDIVSIFNEWVDKNLAPELGDGDTPKDKMAVFLRQQTKDIFSSFAFWNPNATAGDTKWNRVFRTTFLDDIAKAITDAGNAVGDTVGGIGDIIEFIGDSENWLYLLALMVGLGVSVIGFIMLMRQSESGGKGVDSIVG